MTELLEQAIAKLKNRPIREQDSISIDPIQKFGALGLGSTRSRRIFTS